MMYLTISILRNKNKRLTFKNLKILELFFKHKNIYHIYIYIFFSFFLFVLYFISMITQKEFVTYILIYTLFVFFQVFNCL